MGAGLGRAVEPIWLVPFALLTFGRYWVMGTLGRRWTTRIVVLAGAPLIKAGPYRFTRHPNYIVVIGEMVVVPLALGLPAFALAFFAIYACAATSGSAPRTTRCCRPCRRARATSSPSRRPSEVAAGDVRMASRCLRT